jgi:hypothetical protein
MLKRAIRSTIQIAVFVWVCLSTYFRAVVVGLSAFGIAALIRDEFFPQFAKYHIARLLKSNWNWQSWLLLILVVTFIGFAEGPYRKYVQIGTSSGLLLDDAGRRLPSGTELVAPVTLYAALFVMFGLFGIWIYDFVFPQRTVTITGCFSQTFTVIPKGGKKPLPGNIWYFDSPLPSDKPEYPHALKVVIDVSEQMHPLALYIECDTNILEAVVSIAGLPAKGTIQAENDTSVVLTVQDPAVTPEHPAVINLYSKSPLHLKRLSRQ